MATRLKRWMLAVLPVAAAGCRSVPTVPAVQARTDPVSAIAGARPPAGLIRATGTIRAVKSQGIMVPRIQTQQGNRLTLLKLIPNGSAVKQGDLLAEFDRTQQLDLYREAKAKYEELSHQVRQKQAQNRNDAEKRLADIQQAEADLAKANIQLKKGPILSDIDRAKNEAKAASSTARVASLKKIHEHRSNAEAAALKILELQMLRQKVAMERAQSNGEKLVVKAPQDGMVALETVWRNGSMGVPQEGDRLWNGQPLLNIFDPSVMEVHALIGEPDGAVLKSGTTATVHLDAYPDALFQAKFHSASPVATTALGSPIKNFTARFRLEATDVRLLPDLSAAVLIRPEGAVP